MKEFFLNPISLHLICVDRLVINMWSPLIFGYQPGNCCNTAHLGLWKWLCLFEALTFWSWAIFPHYIFGWYLDGLFPPHWSFLSALLFFLRTSFSSETYERMFWLRIHFVILQQFLFLKSVSLNKCVNGTVSFLSFYRCSKVAFISSQDFMPLVREFFVPNDKS